MANHGFRWLNSPKKGKYSNVFPFTTRKRKLKPAEYGEVIYIDFKTRERIQEDPHIQIIKMSILESFMIILYCLYFGIVGTALTLKH